MSKVIICANQKGGVAKTTTVIDTRTSVGIKVGIEAARAGLNTMLDRMDVLDASIEKYDAEMENIMNELDISTYLTSVPGVGKVTATAFVAETGDLSRFDDWKQVRKMAGLSVFF